MRILHVTESLGAGVTTAINSYVNNSQQFEHFLFASVRAADCTGEEDFPKFQKVKIVPRKLVSIFLLRRFIKDLNPDVIHVHSTYAGFIVRIFFRKRVIPIVYTPHGYSFLRNDHPIKKKLYYWVENFLSYNTSIVAGCSKDEANISLSFSSNVRVHELINVCDNIDSNVGDLKRPDRVTVGMVGRVAEQKGFEFFAKVARKVGEDCRFVWIGGGEQYGVEVLENSGVCVSGWVSRKEVIKLVSELDVYFHSAAWDGFPVSVLEAAQLNRPIILREIPPFVVEGLYTVSGVDDACREISYLISGDKAARRRAEINRDKIRSYHKKENLMVALQDLYSQFS